jgi:RluA family pseudouridine synthase
MVLFSDPNILVINKPAGLLCVTDGYKPDLPTVRSVLEEEWGRLFIVHRLDKDTSGVLVLARSPDTHRFLDRQFAERQISKTYHALCIGTPTWEQISIDSRLRVNGDRSHRTIVDSRTGKPAHTQARLVEQFQGYCLVETHPSTGYTHQIRAHLSSIGFPILGDPLYRLPPALKSRPFDLGLFTSFPRTALHALSISIVHPETNEPVTFQAPYSADFLQFLHSTYHP